MGRNSAAEHYEDFMGGNTPVPWERSLDPSQRAVLGARRKVGTSLARGKESGAEAAINVHVNMDTTCGEFCGTKLGMKYANNTCPKRLRGTRFEKILPELQKCPNQKLWIRLMELEAGIDLVPDNEHWFREIWKSLESMSEKNIHVEARVTESQMKTHPVLVDGLSTVGDLKRQTGFTKYSEDGTEGFNYYHFSQRLDEAEDDESLASFCTRMGWSSEVIGMNLKSDEGYRRFERSPRVAIGEQTTAHDLREAVKVGRDANHMKLQDTPLAKLEQVLLHVAHHADVPHIAKEMGVEVEDIIALVSTASDVVVDDEWMAHRKHQMESPDATFEIQGAMNLTCAMFLDRLEIDYGSDRVPQALRGTLLERAIFVIQKTPDTPLWQRLAEIWGKNTTDNLVRENWYGDLWRFLAHISDNKIRVTVLDEDRAMEKHPVIVDGLNTVGDLKAQLGYENDVDTGGLDPAWSGNHWFSRASDDQEVGAFMHGNGLSLDEMGAWLERQDGYELHRRTTRIRLENETQVTYICRALGIEEEPKFAGTDLELLEKTLLSMAGYNYAIDVCEEMGIQMADLVSLLERVIDVEFAEPEA